MLKRVLNIVTTRPIRRGMVLAVVSLAATFLALLHYDGQTPPAHILIPCAAGFGTGWLMMFLGTLVWVHKRWKHNY
ncbi:MAG: hypothetical protein FJX23_01125 [Alphaproteobacteria bacterium]|nr:hypothetical protein [Alphaproteobacteria bacterium]